MRCRQPPYVGVEKPANFLQATFECIGVAISQILRQNHVIATFLHRSLGNVVISCLIRVAIFRESLRNVLGY